MALAIRGLTYYQQPAQMRESFLQQLESEVMAVVEDNCMPLMCGRHELNSVPDEIRLHMCVDVQDIESQS
jgi:hypothetical protein